MYKAPKDSVFVSRFIELGICPIAYKGDLISNYSYWTSSFYVGVKFNKKKRINSEIGLMIGKVAAQNLNYTYNLHPPVIPEQRYFKTNFLLLNYSLRLNLIKTRRHQVYISQGIGALKFSPKDKNNNSLIDDKSSRANKETYNNLSLSFPTKIGFMVNLINNFGFGMEAGFLNPVTDYIDNISKQSNYKKKDNILMYKFSFYIPLSKN